MLLGLAALSLLITPGVISAAESIVARMPSHMEIPAIETREVGVKLSRSEWVRSVCNLNKISTQMQMDELVLLLSLSFHSFKGSIVIDYHKSAS